MRERHGRPKGGRIPLEAKTNLNEGDLVIIERDDGHLLIVTYISTTTDEEPR